MEKYPYFQRILSRFETLFGSNKTKSVFNVSDQSWPDLSATWEQYLRSANPDAIRAALASLAQNPPDWPPALAEFIRLCKQFNRPEHKVALPLPAKQITPEGQKLIESAVQQIRTPAYDPLYWAKYPKSAQAISLLRRGIKDDTRLRDIWQHHIATDGVDCKTEARRQFLAIKDSYQVMVSN